MENVPIKVLLVEDDVNECNIYRTISKKRNDMDLVAITNSSSKALEFVKTYKPDAVILDLELNDGEGSGFDFIEKIKKQNINKMPKIVVTTNVHSNSVYDFCHKNDIDFIFYKKQQNYSQENIINTLLLLREYKADNKLIVPELDEQDMEDIIWDKIDAELKLIGIGTHLQGKKYLRDAIYFAINQEENRKISIVQFLVNKYKKSSSTISRAMQNAILYAWRITPIEDLTNYYTARINYETGVPTPTELIYYYSDKIKKEM